MTWYEPKDPTPREACPCCGYVTLAERGMGLICSVCFWEDDPFIRGAHHVYSVPNSITLAAARQNFAAVGAAEARWLKHVLPLAARALIERRSVEVADPFPPREQCPCCGHCSLPTRYEGWSCATCHWDDSGDAVYRATTVLWMARAKFAQKVVMDARFERRPLVDCDVPEPTHPCPCCDYVTLAERGTESSWCPLCDWSDDASVTTRDAYSACNERTLAEARARFAAGLKVRDEGLFGRVVLEDCALFKRCPVS